MIGVVAACFPTYRPIYRSLMQRFQGRVTNVSHPSGNVSSNARPSKDQWQEIGMMSKPASGQRENWIPLEEDEEMLVRTLGRDRMILGGAN